MAVNIATLAIKFVADTSGIKQGVSSVVSNVLTGAAAFIGINKAISAFTTGAERIDKMSKVADRLGVSFNTIQEAGLTASLAGIELDSLTDAIDKMSKNIGSGGMSLDKRFLEQADAIAAIVDPAEQARAAMEIFGKSGAKLLPLLKQGGKAFREASDLIKRFDLGISDIDAKNVERMNDSWTKLGAVISGATDKIIARMSPAMSSFLDHTIDQLAEAGDLLQDFGLTWDSVGQHATLFFAELANGMDLVKASAKGWQTLGNMILSVNDAAAGDPKASEKHWEAGRKRWEEGQVFLDRFMNDASGTEIRRNAERRRGEFGDGKKTGMFGGRESRLGTGAERDSQAAAKIINAGVTNLTAAEKAAIESAKTERETKRVIEQMRDAIINRPIILGVGAF